MALRSTLATVVEMVREEAGLSTNTSRGTDHLTNIQRLIKRHYTTLAEKHDWEFLRLKRNDSAARKVLSDGTRYYDFPSSVNPLKIVKAWVKWSGQWHLLNYGIDFENYSGFDPAEDQRTDPITHWDFHDGTQFEVWPLPDTNGTADGDNEVAFEGQKAVEALTGNTSRMDMDDVLVSLYCAAELLASGNEKKALLKAGAAKERFDMLQGNTGGRVRVAMGLGVIDEGRNNPRWPRHPIYIR